jgi:glutathione S-transferase
MQGQANHFRMVDRTLYPDQRHTAYGLNRYVNETLRLYGVMEKRLSGREFLADDYSIADMACFGWVNSYPYAGIDLAPFPEVKAWHARITARDGTQRALARADDFRREIGL